MVTNTYEISSSLTVFVTISHRVNFNLAIDNIWLKNKKLENGRLIFAILAIVLATMGLTRFLTLGVRSVIVTNNVSML